MFLAVSDSPASLWTGINDFKLVDMERSIKNSPKSSPAKGELEPGMDELWELDRALKKVVASTLYWVSGLLVMRHKSTVQREKPVSGLHTPEEPHDGRIDE
jgi:hypothetical protein